MFFRAAPHAPFAAVPMERLQSGTDRSLAVWAMDMPRMAAGSELSVYVEARSSGDWGRAVYWPRNTELGAPHWYIEPVHSDSSVVKINEVMAANKTAVKDPQGEYDDWIELVNLADEPVDVSGMYLTDGAENLRKWQFPPGTVIGPRGWLVVWADEHTKSLDGLHTSFKLDVDGEQVLLVDRDDQDNRILDQVQWTTLRADVAYGRTPDGMGEFRPLIATPGAANPQRP
jgi:hypothetical protein